MYDKMKWLITEKKYMLANIANKLKYLYFPLTNFRPYIVYTVCMYKYSRRCKKKKNNPFKHPPPPNKKQ